MQRLSFPKAVANERNLWEPLHDPGNISAVLRRRLFHGDELYAEDGIKAGGTNGVVGAMTRLMEEWGFEFEHVTNDEGKKGVKLKNPQHIPTEHHKRPDSGTRRRRRAQDNGDAAAAADDNGRTHNENPVFEKIRGMLLSGAKISVYESVQMGASDSFLRKEVVKLQAEGYKFATTGFGPERTFKLTRAPKGARRTTTSKAMTKSPVHEVPIGSTTNAADMMFGELETPPPKLGGHLRVMGLMLNDDEDDGAETVSMVIKNGSGMWKARIEGYVEQANTAD